MQRITRMMRLRRIKYFIVKRMFNFLQSNQVNTFVAATFFEVFSDIVSLVTPLFFGYREPFDKRIFTRKLDLS